MPLTLPNGMRFALNGVWGGTRPVVTTWHAIVVHVGSRSAAAYEAAGEIGAAWGEHVVPLLANDYQLQTVNYVDMNSEDGAAGEFILTPAFVGANLATSLPPNVGMLVQKGIADKGRNKRGGRVFIPGGDRAMVNELGVIDTARLTAAETALQTFQNDVNGYSGEAVASMRLVVPHIPSGLMTIEVKRRMPMSDGVITSSDIVGYNAKNIITGIQRRVQTS